MFLSNRALSPRDSIIHVHFFYISRVTDYNLHGKEANIFHLSGNKFDGSLACGSGAGNGAAVDVKVLAREASVGVSGAFLRVRPGVRLVELVDHTAGCGAVGVGILGAGAGDVASVAGHVIGLVLVDTVHKPLFKRLVLDAAVGLRIGGDRACGDMLPVGSVVSTTSGLSVRAARNVLASADEAGVTGEKML